MSAKSTSEADRAMQDSHPGRVVCLTQATEAQALAGSLRPRAARAGPARPASRHRDCLAKWDDPQISGAGWASGLIDSAGGAAVCKHRGAGWGRMPAVHTGRIYQITSPLMVCPGFAASADGPDRPCALIAAETAKGAA